MTIKKDLELIERYQKEICILEQTSALLGWDEQTYMPKKAAKSRAEQNAFLSSLIHEKTTSKEFFEAVKRLKKSNLEGREKRMVEKLYKEISKQKKLPKEFVEELSRATSLGFNAWQEAKQKKDFSIFQPHLKKIVELKRKQTKYIGLPGHPYNSLLDDFEEGMTVEKLKPFFENLKKGLLELLRKIKKTEIYKNQKIKTKETEQSQIELAHELVRGLGFSEENFRVDLSEHPFSTKIGGNDVRITTNIKKGHIQTLRSTIHEAGHALHFLNYPEQEEYTILGQSPSYGLSESQSRFWENMIGLNRPFWQYFFPKFDEKFNFKIDFEDWYKKINQVYPGKIRIEADEVHYCLHIILRFELELGLIDGKIKVEELPQIWDKKMKEFIGIVPENDAEGVLQDVHWSSGYFGYFPSYAIGSIYALQLYEAAKKALPNIEGDIFEGKFERIRDWLKENIHKHGAMMIAEDIIKKICGQGLNPKAYIFYLNEKYKEIYEF